MHAASLLLFVFTAIRSVSALPFPTLVATLPSDITHIAHDEGNNVYIAFKRDGSVYGRYAVDVDGASAGRYETETEVEKRQDSGTCGEATLDQLKQLPDFGLFDKYADENFGKGKRGVVVNPKDFPDRPARSCVSSDPINFEFIGQPNCQELSASSEGQLVGTGGSVAIETQQGFNAKASYTTTRTSFFSVGLKVSATVGIPAIAGASSEFSMNSEFTNENVKSTESQTDNVQKTTITMNAEPGKLCKLENKTKSCSVQGKGQLPFIASGFVWFNYEDRQKGHFKWAANIENVLTKDQRTSVMEITGNVNSESKSSFAGECAFPPGSEGEKKEKEEAQKKVEEEAKKKADEEAKKKADEAKATSSVGTKAASTSTKAAAATPTPTKKAGGKSTTVGDETETSDSDEEEPVLEDEESEADPEVEVEDADETIEAGDEEDVDETVTDSDSEEATSSTKAATSKPTSTKATASSKTTKTTKTTQKSSESAKGSKGTPDVEDTDTDTDTGIEDDTEDAELEDATEEDTDDSEIDN